MSSFFSKLFGVGGTKKVHQSRVGVQTEPQLRCALEIQRALVALSQMPHDSTHLDRLLEGKAEWPQTVWKQFVLEHGGPMAWYRKFKGGHMASAVQSWGHSLDIWAKEAGFFFKTSMCAPLAQELTARFHRATELSALLQVSAQEAAACDCLTSHTKRFLDALEVDLRSHQVSYVFASTRGKETGEVGHAVCIRFHVVEEVVYCSILNVGQGCSEHPVLKMTSTEDLYSYRSFPFAIGSINKLKSSRKVRSGISQIIQYQSLPPIGDLDYHASDLYDVFRTMGEVRPDFDGFSEELLAVPLQKEPNCSVMAVQLFVRDNLAPLLAQTHSNEATLKVEIEKILLLYRFSALLSAFVTPADRAEKAAFDSALQRFSAEVHAAHPLQKQQEGAIVFDNDDVKRIQRALRRMRNKKVERETQVDVLESLTERRCQQKSLQNMQLSTVQQQLSPALLKMESAMDLLPPNTTDNSILDKLAAWMHYMGDLPQPQRFDYFMHVVYSLPLPNAKDDEQDFWQQIPSDELCPLIQQLRALAQLGFRDIEKPWQDNRESCLEDHFLTLHTLYAIVDKLARCDPENGLGVFASPFLLEDVKKKRTFATLLFGDQQERYAHLEQYFKESAKQRYVIFPVAPLLEVGAAGQSIDRSSHTRLANHYRYVRQFAGDKKVEERWLHGIPQPVQDLYWFAFVSQAIIPDCGFCGAEFLPEELSFRFGAKDSNGFAILEMNPAAVGERPPYTTGLDSSHSKWQKKRPKDWYGRKLTTNETVTTWKPDAVSTVTDDFWRRLLRDSNEDDLALYTLMEELLLNLRALSNPIVRSEIHRALFAPGVLKRAFDTDPTMIDLIRRVFRAVLDEFGVGEQMVDIHIFLLECSIMVESLVPREKRCFDLVDSLRAPLTGKKTSRAEITYLFDCALILAPSDCFSKQELRNLATRFFDPSWWSNLSGYSCFHYQKKKLAPLLANKIRSTLERNKDYSGEFAQLAIAYLVKQTVSLNSWVLKDSVLSNGEWELDIANQRIRKSSGATYKHLVLGSTFKLKYGYAIGRHAWQKQDDGHYYVEGAPFRVVTEKNQRIVERKVGSSVCWAQYVAIVPASIEGTFLEELASKYDAFYDPKAECLYLFRDDKSANPEIVIKNFNGDREMISHEMDVKSRIGENHIVDLASIEPGSKLAPFASRLCFPETVKCVVDKTGSIYLLHFTDINLVLRREMHPLFGRLKAGEIWENYPDALVFGDSVKKRVLLPARVLALSGPQLATAVAPQKRLLPNFKKSYFVFDVDSASGALIAEEPTDYLYLALLYKMRRDYTMATFYLDQVKTTRNLVEEAGSILDCLQELMERSYEAYAFHMKLLFVLVDNQMTLRDSQFISRSVFGPDLLSWAKKSYLDYLGTIGMDGATSRIPKHLQPTPMMEMAILRFLKYSYDNQTDGGKPEMPPALETRRLLLCTPDNNAKFKTPQTDVFQSPQGVRKHLMPFDELLKADVPREQGRKNPWPSGLPVRYASGVIRHHFRDLFEQARQCAAGSSGQDFDFILQALFKSREHFARSDSYFATLLYHVRQSEPEQFSPAALAATNKDSLCEQIIAILEMDPEVKKREDALKVPDFKYNEGQKEYVHYFENRVKYERSVFELPKARAGIFADPFGQHLKILESGSLENWEAIACSLRKQSEAEHQNLEAEHAALVQQLNRKMAVGELESSLEEIAIDAGQRIALLPAFVMKEVVLRGDRSFLKQHRPEMTDEEMDTLCLKVMEYYHKLGIYNHLSQIHEAVTARVFNSRNLKLYQDQIAVLNKAAVADDDEIANALSGQTEAEESLAHLPSWDQIKVQMEQHYCWDPLAYPEISYYQVISGKMPRLKQFEVHTWVCKLIQERGKGLFQFPAGAGKTSYLRQLFMLRAQMEGLLPVCVTPEAIYEVDHKNLQEAWVALGESLGIMELGLRHKPGLEEFKMIYYELKRFRWERRALLITPQTFYALQLHAKNAALAASQLDPSSKAYDEECQKLFWIESILRFFKEDCLLLMDESQTTLDASKRAVIGSKRYSRLKQKDIGCMVDLIAPILGDSEHSYLEACGKQITERLGLVSEPVFQDKNPSPAMVNEIKNAIATEFLRSKGLPLELVDFLFDKSVAPPQSFQELSAEIQNELALCRHFLTVLLEKLIELRTVRDHQPSVFSNEHHHTPAQNKTPSTAQFHDPLLTAALTIKAYYQMGLNEEQCQLLLKQMIELDLYHREQFGVEISYYQKIYTTWGFAKEPALRHLNPDDPETIQQIFSLMYKQKNAIRLFLLEIGLKEIGYCPEQAACSPADFANAFGPAIFFSATPGLELTYPLSIDRWYRDTQFEDHVVSVCCQDRNKEIRPFYAIEDLLRDPCHVIIDPQGFLTMDNEQLVTDWMRSNSLLQACVFFTREGLALKTNEGTIHKLKGSHSIVATLRELGYDLFSGEVGVFFDVEHVEAADIFLPSKFLDSSNVLASVIIHKDIEKQRLIQAVMRMRRFLDEDSGQLIRWFVHGEVQTIRSLENVSQIFDFADENERLNATKKRAVMAAFQEISVRVAARFREEVDAVFQSHIRCRKPLMEAYLARRKGLIEESERNWVAAFSVPERDQDVGKALLAFANHLNRLYYGEDVDPALIKPVVSRLKPFVPKISTSFQQNSTVQMQQQMQEMMEAQVAEMKPRSENPLEAKHTYGGMLITSEDFYDQVRGHMRASKFYGHPDLLPFVHLDTNHTQTATFANEPDKKLVKSISSFILLRKGENLVAFVTSDDLVASYILQMRNFKKSQSPHKILIVSALTGKVMERGEGGIQMSEEEIQAISKSEWLLKLRIHAGLVNGILLSESMGIPKAALQRELSALPGIEELFGKLLEAQISSTSGTRTKLEAMQERLRGLMGEG